MSQSLRLLAPAAALLCAAAIAGPQGEKSPPSDAYLRYQSLESETARNLLEKACLFGRRRLGEPAIPVRRVHLRRSVPIDPSAGLIRDFQLTEIVDADRGVFAIYLSAGPEDANFGGQLAHETFHLSNARLLDVYVEGLNCLLAEEFLRELGHDWERWRRHFENGKEPLYAAAYFLLKDIAAESGREPLDRLLAFAVDAAAGGERMEIDIDRWLKSLPLPERARALAAIERRYEPLDTIRKEEQPRLAFRRPRK